MSDHAPHAPSSAFRRWRCPGSRALEARRFKADTPQSREGTAAHEVLSTLLTTGELVPVGTLMANGVPCDDDMQAGAQLMARDVLERCGLVTTAILVEQPVAAQNLIHAGCWGTPDARYVDRQRKRIRCWDYKYGHGYVEVHENPQGIEYLAGIIETDLGGWPEDDQEWTFEFTIVQPREYGREGPVRRWCGKLTDLRACFNYASSCEALSADHHAPTIPGVKQCANCSAIPGCEGNQRAVSYLLDYVAGNVVFDPPPELVGRELTKLTEAHKMIGDRITGLQAEAEQFLRMGRQVLGWQMGQGQSRLKWYKPDAEVIAALKLIAGVDVSKTVPYTPTQAIQKLGIDEAVISAYAHRPPAERKLVPTTHLDKVFKK